MRAYIESHDKNEDNFAILIHIDEVLAGKVDIDNQKPWLFTMSNEDGDLVINNSAGMEANKWDHITLEITGSRQEHTWLI